MIKLALHEKFPTFVQAFVAAQDFVRWWHEEMVSLCPRQVRGFLANPDVTFLNCQSPGAEFPAPSMAGNSAILRLSGPQIFTRRTDVPQLTPLETKRLMNFEIGRLLPFPEGSAVWGYRPIGTDKSRGRQRVLVVAVQTAILQDLVGRLEHQGWRLDRVEAEAEGDQIILRQEPPAHCRRRLLSRLLQASWALLVAAALIVPAQVRRTALADLANATASVRGQAEEVEQGRRDLALIEQAVRSRSKTQGERARMLTVIEALSRTLPDDTWLTELDLSGNDLRITGTSTSAAKLIALLEGANRFSDIQFRSPVIQSAGVQGEKFEIVARLDVRER